MVGKSITKVAPTIAPKILGPLGFLTSLLNPTSTQTKNQEEKSSPGYSNRFSDKDPNNQPMITQQDVETGKLQGDMPSDARTMKPDDHISPESDQALRDLNMHGGTVEP